MGGFIFNLSPQIIAGTDVLDSLGEAVSAYGTRFMLILDPSFKDVELIIKVKQSLEQKGLKLFSFDAIKKSPDTETVLRALKLAEVAHIDGVVVVGNMVTCTVAKAVAGLYNEKASIYSYLEGKPITEKPLPLVQIPTTCDNPFLLANSIYITDSRNRSISALKCRDGVSPLIVFDSNFIKSLSLNAMRQLILSSVTIAVDAYVSRRSNFFSDALLKKAIQLLVATLDAENDALTGQSVEETLVQCAVLISIALGTSSAGLATAVATVGNGRYGVSFSSFLPMLLPHVLKESMTSNLQKVSEVAGCFLKEKHDGNEDLESLSARGIEAITSKLLALELPSRLESLELSSDDLSIVAEAVLAIDFLNYIPRSMTSLDVLDILKQAY